MRFRTKIINASLMNKVVKSLQSTAKSCVIKLGPESVHFIVSDSESGPSGVQIWSQVKVVTLFDEYRIESRGNNEIYLEIGLEPLSKALRSAEMVGTTGRDSEAGVKLSKKNDKAVLVFDIVGQGNGPTPISITHDVTCLVLNPSRVAQLKEPLCPQPDIHVHLPSLAQLKGLASRFSHLGSTVSISANKKGEMLFTVQSDGLKMETKWEKLAIPNFNQEADQQPAQEVDPEEAPTFSVSISIKNLLKFLATNLANTTTIACICDNYCLIAYVYIGEPNEAAGVLTLFIPKSEA
ncbi:checkpoint protein Hus1/Mec3 [Filobasidium floriforme]|uniref:checkpoint protein Hus1/Mec3 n=1 Tax=Filobasidium floriforme TaxID=5210 RepID=UPI001E8EBA07|nr:checkpoint protein Hus1/Mec3 [Filobasidium floriforme]KAH8081492.1 checkpoint protein Hus1/Mec3 [Filobasidium floriforme]